MLAFTTRKSPGHVGEKTNGKYNKLKNDVQATFRHKTGIQILLITEFGNMFEKLSNVEQIFTTLLDDLNLFFYRLRGNATICCIDR